jgi:hypothetical protein
MSNFSPPLHNWTPHSRKILSHCPFKKYLENKLSVLYTCTHSSWLLCFKDASSSTVFMSQEQLCAQSFFSFLFFGKKSPKGNTVFYFFLNGIFYQNKFPLFRKNSPETVFFFSGPYNSLPRFQIWSQPILRIFHGESGTNSPFFWRNFFKNH